MSDNMSKTILDLTKCEYKLHKRLGTRIVLHAVHITATNIVVTARDTDVILLLIIIFQKWTVHVNGLWLAQQKVENVFHALNLPTNLTNAAESAYGVPCSEYVQAIFNNEDDSVEHG